MENKTTFKNKNKEYSIIRQRNYIKNIKNTKIVYDK